MEVLLILLGLIAGTSVVEGSKANKHEYTVTPLHTENNVTTYAMTPVKSGTHRTITSQETLPDTLTYRDFKTLKSSDKVNVLKKKDLKDLNLQTK